MTGFGRLLRAEWTKIRSVRSTAWSLVLLVVAGIGLNTLVVGLAIANWNSTSASTKASYAADPTGFLAAAVALAQIPLCVLGALVITSEYSTGMIRSSVLAVPRRVPMLAAKAVVFGALAFVVGQLVGFGSYLIAQAIIGHHLPESLGDLSTLRAVFGVGLYLAVLGLFAFAIGALVRHTGAAITIAVGFVVVVSQLAALLPGSVGHHIQDYLPSNAGLMITRAHQEASNLLSPWQGFGVLCIWTVALLGVATYALKRRDV
jgi:ABC-type transport system involved in multi-copper enzyme maturation permease subunit